MLDVGFEQIDALEGRQYVGQRHRTDELDELEVLFLTIVRNLEIFQLKVGHNLIILVRNHDVGLDQLCRDAHNILGGGFLLLRRRLRARVLSKGGAESHTARQHDGN